MLGRKKKLEQKVNPILKELQDIKAFNLEKTRLEKLPIIELERKQIIEKLKVLPTNSFIVEHQENVEYFLSIGLCIEHNFHYKHTVRIP